MTDSKCRWCGHSHEAKCQLVKAIDYAEDGVTVRHIEFFAPKDYHPISLPYSQPQTAPYPQQQWTVTSNSTGST